jgi:uncharacterized protein YbjT (DUF2867 family)
MTAPAGDKLAVVFGGSGFIGRYIVNALARRGWRVRAAMRRPDLAGHLQPLGTVGQIHAVQANLRYPQSVRAAAIGADAVINCVGILAEGGRQKFDAVHISGARAVAEAAREAGARALVQFSALGADANSPSAYARSKAEGEAEALAVYPDAVLLRPAVVFGPEDQFFNRFAAMARRTPVMPLVGGATRFQPVYVVDVAEAVIRALEGRAQPGAAYELGGPRIFTFRQLLEITLRESGRSRRLVPIPLRIARPLAAVLEWLPGAPLTRDQVRLLERDNIVSESASAEGRTLAGLGIAPSELETIVPTFLSRYRPQGEFGAATVGSQD